MEENNGRDRRVEGQRPRKRGELRWGGPGGDGRRVDKTKTSEVAAAAATEDSAGEARPMHTTHTCLNTLNDFIYNCIQV